MAGEVKIDYGDGEWSILMYDGEGTLVDRYDVKEVIFTLEALKRIYFRRDDNEKDIGRPVEGRRPEIV